MPIPDRIKELGERTVTEGELKAMLGFDANKGDKALAEAMRNDLLEYFRFILSDSNSSSILRDGTHGAVLVGHITVFITESLTMDPLVDSNKHLIQFMQEAIRANNLIMGGLRAAATANSSSSKVVLDKTIISPIPTEINTDIYDALDRSLKDATHAKFVGDKSSGGVEDYVGKKQYNTAAEALVGTLSRFDKLSNYGAAKNFALDDFGVRGPGTHKSTVEKDLDQRERDDILASLFGSPVPAGSKIEFYKDNPAVGKIFSGADLLFEITAFQDPVTSKWSKLEWDLKRSFDDLLNDYFDRKTALEMIVRLAVKTNKDLKEPELNLVIPAENPSSPLENRGPNIIIKAFAAANQGLNPCFDAAAKKDFDDYMITLRALATTHPKNTAAGFIYNDILAQAGAVIKFKDYVGGDTVWTPGLTDLTVDRKKITEAEPYTIEYQDNLIASFKADKSYDPEHIDALEERRERIVASSNARDSNTSTQATKKLTAYGAPDPNAGLTPKTNIIRRGNKRTPGVT